MAVNLNIFKSYDIRGIYPAEINEETAYLLGKTFCLFLDQKQISGPVLIGHDARLSSENLKKEFIRAVLSQGRDVFDIDLATTPLFYFSFIKSGVAGGAIITASHNPKEYNGFKMLVKPWQSLYQEFGLPDLKELIQKADAFPDKKIGGKKKTADFSEDYLNFIFKTSGIQFSGVQNSGSVKVVADVSNGSAGFLLKRFFEKTKINHIPLFFEPDGNFPNHSPNPFLEESHNAARAKIIETKADFGVILDGDGDRIIFLNEKGEAVQNDIIYAFLIDHLFSPGEKAIFDVRSSRIIEEVARRKGIEIKRNRVGHAFIREAMKKENCRLMVEGSGHYYFKDFFYSDSSLLALAYILNFYLKQKKTFSELFKTYQKYFSSGELNFKAENPEKIFEQLKEKYKTGRQYFIDGLSVEYPDFWFNVRKSNTEPLVRLVIEAESASLLAQKKQEIFNIMDVQRP